MYSYIYDKLWHWIKSYIENRSQCIVLSGYASQFKSISSGVPQGSHLGPLLFTRFINDIDEYIKHSNVLLYADGTKKIKYINTVENCYLLQRDLINFELFCKDNVLFLNIKKCFVINFSRKKRSVEFEYTLFNSHLNRVTQV